MNRILALILMFMGALTPAAAWETAPPLPAPALWKISDADSALYLFGAAPFLPAGEAWRSRAVAAAIDRSEIIVFEAPSADPAARAEAEKIFRDAGYYAGNSTLSATLGADGAAGLASVASALGAEPSRFDSLKPWAAFVVLSAELDRKRGANPAEGVEMGVLMEAIGRQRPVRFLDTVGGALRVLTEMPDEDQRALLNYLLTDWRRQDAESAATFSSWRTGDVDALAFRTQTPLSEAAPAAYARLIVARSDLLEDRIAALLEKSEEAFVCLSAALVVGADGVAAGLAERGFKVERLDTSP